MKKLLLFCVCSLSLGLALGWFAAIEAFALKVDLLGVPYSNAPVVADRRITVTQGELSVVIPKGAKVIHRYTAKGLPIYALQFVGTAFEKNPFSEAVSDELFWLETEGNGDQ